MQQGVEATRGALGRRRRDVEATVTLLQRETRALRTDLDRATRDY